MTKNRLRKRSIALILILRNTTDNKPTSVVHETNIELSSAIDLMINKYETHPSIIDK